MSSEEELQTLFNIQDHVITNLTSPSSVHMPHGGHIGSLETPELLVEDIRKFGRKFRIK